jgi:hypothetical protein
MKENPGLIPFEKNYMLYPCILDEVVDITGNFLFSG